MLRHAWYGVDIGSGIGSEWHGWECFGMVGNGQYNPTAFTECPDSNSPFIIHHLPAIHYYQHHQHHQHHHQHHLRDACMHACMHNSDLPTDQTKQTNNYVYVRPSTSTSSFLKRGSSEDAVAVAVAGAGYIYTKIHQNSLCCRQDQ